MWNCNVLIGDSRDLISNRNWQLKILLTIHTNTPQRTETILNIPYSSLAFNAFSNTVPEQNIPSSATNAYFAHLHVDKTIVIRGKISTALAGVLKVTVDLPPSHTMWEMDENIITDSKLQCSHSTLRSLTDGRKAAWHSFRIVQFSGREASLWLMTLKNSNRIMACKPYKCLQNKCFSTVLTSHVH